MRLERLYLDYNATSPLSPSVLDWLRSGEISFANPSSQHSRGKAARKSVNEARSSLYKIFHESQSEKKLFFHSGATEGMTSFAYSFSEFTRKSHKKLLICYSGVDHPAVVSLSERYWGDHVSFYELKRDEDLNYLDRENFQTIQDLKSNYPELVILYHHLWVHNETGLISSLDKLSIFEEISDLYIHVDAVQVPGKIIDWKNLSHGHIWTFSAHKFGALKGVGFSFMHKAVPFYSLIGGGGQQQGLRSGTENTQGIITAALALDEINQVDVTKNIAQRKKLENFLKENLNGLGQVISYQEQNSNTIYFYLNSYSSDIALALFDLEGLEISAGSACSSGAARPSAVLTHMGLHHVAKNGLRISFGFQISDEEVEFLKERLTKVIAKIRASLS